MKADSAGATRAMVGAALCFASVEWLGRHLPPRYSPIQVVWSRYGFHLLAILAFSAWKGRNPLKTTRPGLQIGRSLLMLAMPASFVVALGSSSSDNVWALFWVAPLIALFRDARSAGGRLSAGRWGLAFCAYMGVIVALRPTLPVPATALAASGCMAIVFAGYLMVTQELRSESVLSRLFYTALGVFVFLTPFVPGLFVLPSREAWAVLLAIGLVGLVCLWLLDEAVDRAGVGRMAPLLYLVPVASVLLDTIGSRIPPGRSAIVGAILVCVALWGWTRQAPQSPLGRST